MKQLKHSQQKKRRQQRPRDTTAAARVRALNFILEQNRLLQRDNAALIKQLARLRQELDDAKPKPEKKPVKRAPAVAKVAKAGKSKDRN